MEMNLFNSSEKVSFYDVLGKSEETVSGEKITTWTLHLPKTVSRQDLLDIKEFLLGQSRGNTRIELLLGTQRIDTKLTLSDTKSLEEWAKARWQN